MKILAPTNNASEVEPLIKSGANELYCGILSKCWLKKYGNIASQNRREWKTANILDHKELRKIIHIARSHRVPVHVTLNAIYTTDQYPYLEQQLNRLIEMKADGVIVADIGFLQYLRKKDIGIDVNISTGGTAFNSKSVAFYKNLGAARIIFPRQIKLEEMESIVKNHPSVKFEAFILNSGCKNIDGFCTFHHGIKEVKHNALWNIPKKMNADRYFLDMIRRLPSRLSQYIPGAVFGIDSACLLNYKINFMNASPCAQTREQMLRKISSAFNLLSGVDTCGACRLVELKRMGIYGIKIVGRNYSLSKKLKDTRFLKRILQYIDTSTISLKTFPEYVKNVYKEVYKISCGNVCYYPFPKDLKKPTLRHGNEKDANTID